MASLWCLGSSWSCLYKVSWAKKICLFSGFPADCKFVFILVDVGDLKCELCCHVIEAINQGVPAQIVLYASPYLN